MRLDEGRRPFFAMSLRAVLCPYLSLPRIGQGQIRFDLCPCLPRSPGAAEDADAREWCAFPSPHVAVRVTVSRVRWVVLQLGVVVDLVCYRVVMCPAWAAG